MRFGTRKICDYSLQSTAPHCIGLPCTIYFSIFCALKQQGGCFTASKGCQPPQGKLVVPPAARLWLSRTLNSSITDGQGAMMAGCGVCVAPAGIAAQQPKPLKQPGSQAGGSWHTGIYRCFHQSAFSALRAFMN